MAKMSTTGKSHNTCKVAVHVVPRDLIAADKSVQVPWMMAKQEVERRRAEKIGAREGDN